MSDSRAGCATTDPGALGGGRCPAPSLRPPRDLPAGKASRIHAAPGQVWRSHRPRGQARR